MKAIKKVLRYAEYICEAIKYIAFYPIAKMYYRNRHIRIFAERGNDARDNGYHMYRFYREIHPELESYYIISKKSADRTKIDALGNAINYRSLKHYLLFIAAEYKISTHIMGYSPCVDFYTRFADKLHVKGHRIFLQHGVIKDDLPALYSSKTNLDIFICGAKPEFEFVNETFGYRNGEVKYTGLARYDKLHDIEVKKQILCMPTWRKYLKYDPHIKLEESEYVKKWNSLLTDSELIAALRENNIQMVFYPHYELQNNLSVFESNCDEVVIASFDNYDVQQLLKESALLITDYSSVFFDFAYMKKPVIYFQFDKERFLKEHYSVGYFGYSSMGFGEVEFKKDDVVKTVIAYIENGVVMSEKYRNRAELFFPLHDENNCERIFNEIERL